VPRLDHDPASRSYRLQGWSALPRQEKPSTDLLQHGRRHRREAQLEELRVGRASGVSGGGVGSASSSAPAPIHPTSHAMQGYSMGSEETKNRLKPRKA